ncbi:hypothetical protein DKX38_018994 [Salix brachista]|uniref:Uncharacterized protein n=1 Tax=Salix brachista TaxID=2182728 RepID=A0A5N5KPK0_9ROSI|nr:hypothetical protein DKX38_018994 [Salix brachista]
MADQGLNHIRVELLVRSKTLHQGISFLAGSVPLTFTGNHGRSAKGVESLHFTPLDYIQVRGTCGLGSWIFCFELFITTSFMFSLCLSGLL